MKNHPVSRAACTMILLSALMAGGCATIVKGGSQSVTVKTDPAGATCEFNKSGKTIAIVNPTPGTAKLDKGAAALDVVCRKPRFLDGVSKLSSSFQGWTLGNVIFGGVVGIVVDAGSGAMHEYPSEISMDLLPESFPSDSNRDAYFDALAVKSRKQLDEKRETLGAKCAKDQCTRQLKQFDDEAAKAIEQLETNRKMAKIDPTAVAIVAPEVTTPAPVPSPTQKTVAPKPTTTDARLEEVSPYLKAGDKWKYNFVDRGRAAGSMTVEIVETRGSRVRERFTREGYNGFVVEREIDTAFDASHFHAPVLLPGGYYLTEITPYLTPGTNLKTGQYWDDVPGQFSVGSRVSANSRIRVVSRETISVPAGMFSAWKIESESEETQLSQGIRVRVRCTFWYSTEIKRTIKMQFESMVSVYSLSGTEYYELVSFEGARAGASSASVH